MRGSSHVVFGVAGAVVIASLLPTHPAGAPLTLTGAISPDLLAEKIIYYGFAALGALTPDIDNARSTLGSRLGVISKGIQHIAGHRTIFHSIVGLVGVGAIVWAAQYALGLALFHLGLPQTGESLGSGIAPSGFLAPGVGIAFGGLMIGYFLHLVADSLTEGGVPWLWPSHVRYGFPPDHHMRFRTGSVWEPIIVVTVSVLVIIGLFLGALHL